MRNSISDQLAVTHAEVLRKLQDVNIDVLGSKCQLLRIVQGTVDSMGDYEETIRSNLINNAIITRPFAGEVRMFGDYDPDTMQLNSTALDLYEFLPITLKVRYDGDPNTEAIALQKGDLLVEILVDEHKNKIPLIMEVTKLFGNFLGKHLAAKHYELTLYRGQIPTQVKDYINRYIDGELG